METKSLTRKLLTAGAFFAFFLFGFMDNLKGPVIPVLFADLGFSNTRGSNLMLFSYLGFMAATLAAGRLSHWLGEKRLLIAAGVCLAVGAFGFSSFSFFVLLAIFLFILGSGMGTIEVSANQLISGLYTEKKGKFLNLLAFFHGAGSMLSPLYAGFLLGNAISWRTVYRSVVPLVLLMPLFLIFIKTASSASDEEKLSSERQTLFSMKVLAPSFFLLFYVSAEIGIASWMVNFLQIERGFSVVLSSFFLSLYFGLMTVGRLLGSLFVDRFSYRNILAIALVGAIFSFSLALLIPGAGIGFPITGFFFSLMFPTATASAVHSWKGHSGLLLGLLFFAAGIGGMAGPWIIGVFNDLTGVIGGMSTNYCFFFFMGLSLFFFNKE